MNDNVSLRSILGNKTPPVSLKLMLDANASSTLPKRQKRRAPLPPIVHESNRATDIPVTYQKTRNNEEVKVPLRPMTQSCQPCQKNGGNSVSLQIIEDFGDLKSSKILGLDLCRQLDELNTIAKYVNDLEKRLLRSKNPFDDDDDYDDKLNPFADEASAVDKMNPFADDMDDMDGVKNLNQTSPLESDNEHGQIQENKSKKTHLMKIGRTVMPKTNSSDVILKIEASTSVSSAPPKRTASVNASTHDDSIPLRRNDETRYSMTTKSTKDERPRLSRTNSENNYDPFGQIKKQFIRASTKFRREPLNIGAKHPSRGLSRPVQRHFKDLQVGFLSAFLS